MFDANARHIPAGRKFFVEAHSVNQNYATYRKLLKAGNIYLCEKVDGDAENYQIKLYLNSSCRDYLLAKVDFHNEALFDYDSFFVYSGRPDGTGFICDKWKQKALEFLNGKWEE